MPNKIDSKNIVWDEIDRNNIVWDQAKQPSLLQSVGQGAMQTLGNIGKVYPAVETGLNLLTSIYGVPISGFAGMGAQTLKNMGMNIDPTSIAEGIQKALVYQPQTQAGQQLTEATNYPMQKLGEASESVAGAVTEVAGPELGTLAGTALQAAPLAIGGKPWKMTTKGGAMRTADQLAALKAVEKYDIPLSPKNITPSFAAKAYQIATDYFPTGRFWASLKRAEIPEAIMNMKNDVYSALKRVSEPTETIKAEVQKGISDIVTGYEKTASEGYKQLVPQLEKGGKETVMGVPSELIFDRTEAPVKIPMTETIKYMQNEKLHVPKDAKSFFNEFLQKSRGSEWDAKSIDLFQSQAYKRIKGFKGTYYDLMDAMKRDIKNWDAEVGGKAVEYLEQGKKNFREAAILEENPIVRNFMALDKWQNPNMVTAFSRATVEEALQVKKQVSPQTWEMMKTNLMQELSDKATVKGIESPNAAFAPGVWADSFYKMEPKIKALFPNEYNTWRDMANVFRLAAEDMLKAKRGEGWWMGSAIIGGLTVWQPVIAVPAGFSFMVSKSLMNPHGWLRKWVSRERGSKLPGHLRVGAGIAGASESAQKRNRPTLTIRGGEQAEPEITYE